MHKERCNKPRHHMDENWPEQQMPARIYPHNTHLSCIPGGLHESGSDGLNKYAAVRDYGQVATWLDELLLNKDEPTTYKLLIESFRAWDEVKRCGLGAMVDPKHSYRDGSVKYNTGYLFQGLLEHIANADKIAGTLPSWWDAEKRDACIKVAKEMFHWDDLPGAGVPMEVNEPYRYGGPPLRQPLRTLGMKIEGISLEEALLLGYWKVKELPGGRIALHNEADPSSFD